MCSTFSLLAFAFFKAVFITGILFAQYPMKALAQTSSSSPEPNLDEGKLDKLEKMSIIQICIAAAIGGIFLITVIVLTVCLLHKKCPCYKFWLPSTIQKPPKKDTEAPEKSEHPPQPDLPEQKDSEKHCPVQDQDQSEPNISQKYGHVLNQEPSEPKSSEKSTQKPGNRPLKDPEDVCYGKPIRGLNSDKVFGKDVDEPSLQNSAEKSNHASTQQPTETNQSETNEGPESNTTQGSKVSEGESVRGETLGMMDTQAEGDPFGWWEESHQGDGKKISLLDSQEYEDTQDDD